MAYVDTLIERLKKEKYTGAETVDFLRDVQRLQKGEPYEYVLGHTLFLGCHIDLSLRPMIPRPESAFWLERAITELTMKQETLDRPLRVADIFSGSGALGIALLTYLPNATATISELDPKLANQIEINLEKNTIDKNRAEVITASSLEGLPGKYDAIVAVPPYIPYEALPELDKEMIDYEPHLAFLAHDDGHEFQKILINEAWDLLEEGGTLYMEADMDHDVWVREHLTHTPWSKVEFWADPYGATPNVVLRK